VREGWMLLYLGAGFVYYIKFSGFIPVLSTELINVNDNLKVYILFSFKTNKFAAILFSLVLINLVCSADSITIKVNLSYVLNGFRLF